MFNPQTFVSLLAAASVAVNVAAQTRVEDNDIPQQCRSVCQALIAQSTNCDDQYSQDSSNESGDQNYRNCICGAQNANNYIPQCNSCIVQDSNYLNNNNNGVSNDNGYSEVNEWMQTCGFSSTNYNNINNGVGLTPTLTYGGYVSPTGNYYNSGDGDSLTYSTSYNQFGNPQVVQTPAPTAGVGVAGSYYDANNQNNINNGNTIEQAQGGYYPGNVIAGNYGTPTSVSYTTTTSEDQYGNKQTFVTPVTTFYASLTTSWSTTKSTDAFGNAATYSVPYVSFNGAAKPLATAQVVVGAGAGLLMAALAL